AFSLRCFKLKNWSDRLGTTLILSDRTSILLAHYHTFFTVNSVSSHALMSNSFCFRGTAFPTSERFRLLAHSCVSALLWGVRRPNSYLGKLLSRTSRTCSTAKKRRGLTELAVQAKTV